MHHFLTIGHTMTTTSPQDSAGSADSSALPVRAGEDAWTEAEVAEIRAELEADVARLTEELQTSEHDLESLMRDDGSGSGDDSADTGGKVLEREQGMTLTANSRLLLAQSSRALEHIDAGSYGRCESCGQPIGKGRLQAFPRATLCVSCKQKQERR